MVLLHGGYFKSGILEDGTPGDTRVPGPIPALILPCRQISAQPV
jgi:hypothetical protein